MDSQAARYWAIPKEPTVKGSSACRTCGAAFDVNRDIRLVNSRRGYTLPEPAWCHDCGQALDLLPVRSNSEEGS